MSKVKDAVTLAMLLVAIVFSAGLLTLPEYSSAGLDVSGLSSSAPSWETYRPNVTSPPVSSVASPAVTPEPLYTERDVEMMAKTIWAEARGVPSDAEKAAVAWCALNRLDAGTYGETLAEVLTTPWQFAYYESSPVTPELEALARDVLERWQAEQRGAEGVGRTLPEDYFFFEGDGLRNHFRKTYEKPGRRGIGAYQTPTGRRLYEQDYPENVQNLQLRQAAREFLLRRQRIQAERQLQEPLPQRAGAVQLRRRAGNQETENGR